MPTEIEGKVIAELPMQSGVSKAGREWKKREWVLETFGNYPRKIKFDIFGDRSDMFNIVIGSNYKIQVDIESREFNGRWYTDVHAFNVMPMDSAAPQATQPGYVPAPQPGFAPAQGGVPAQPAAPAAPVDPFAPGAPTDDLPF